MYQRSIGSEQIGDGRSVKEEREEVFCEERDCRERCGARSGANSERSGEQSVPLPPMFFVSVGNKGVTGIWRVSRGNKGVRRE
jgi:hypothetical protein